MEGEPEQRAVDEDAPTVERLKRDGIQVEDEWLRRIGPVHFSHVNFRGTMRFGVEKFAAALIQRAPSQATRMAS